MEYYGCHTHKDSNSYIGVGFNLLSPDCTAYIEDCAPNVTCKGLIMGNQALSISQICCLFRTKTHNMTEFVVSVFGPSLADQEQTSGVVDILYSIGQQAVTYDEFRPFFRSIKEGQMIHAVDSLMKTEWCHAHIDRCSKDAECIKSKQ